MKSQRRHELQTNELADHLGKYVQAVRPYRHLILFGCLAVVGIIGAGIYLSNQSKAKTAAGWSDFFGALGTSDAAGLADVASMHSGTEASLWALQTAGDFDLASGSSMRVRDKAVAEKSLRDAAKSYKAVEEAASDHPMLLQRSRFGLAQVYESLCELEKAREYYDMIAAVDPDSSLAQVAKHRSENLSRKSERRWYAWFEGEDLKPPPPPEGIGGIPGMMDELSGRPDLSIPGTDPLAPGSESVDTDVPLGPVLNPASPPEGNESTVPAETPEDAMDTAEGTPDAPADETSAPDGAKAKPAEAPAKPEESAPEAEADSKGESEQPGSSKADPDASATEPEEETVDSPKETADEPSESS